MSIQQSQRGWRLIWNATAVVSLVLILTSFRYARHLTPEREPLTDQSLKADVWKPTPVPDLPSRHVSLLDAPSRGVSTARVVMILFADFECPFSGRFAAQTLPDVERDFIATGRVLLVFRHLPLQTLHREAMAAAEAAECARDQGAFWEMHDDLFMSSHQLDRPALEYRAELSGLDREQFQKCLITHAKQKRIVEDMAEARSLNVTSTPTVLLGRRDFQGAVNIERRFNGSAPFGTIGAAMEAMLHSSDARSK
jgi:protein-disulfide isomerase